MVRRGIEDTIYIDPPTLDTPHSIMAQFTPLALRRLRKSFSTGYSSADPVHDYTFGGECTKSVDWSSFWNDDYDAARAPKNVEVFYMYGEQTVSVYAVVYARGQDTVFYGHSVFRYGYTDADFTFNKAHKRNSRRTALARLFYSNGGQAVSVNLERARRSAESRTAAHLRAEGKGSDAAWLRSKDGKFKTLAEYKAEDEAENNVRLSKYAAATVSSYEEAVREEIHSKVCKSRTSPGRVADRSAARSFGDFASALASVASALGVDVSQHAESDDDE